MTKPMTCASSLSMRAIARKLDLNFKTVRMRRYLCAGSVDSVLAGGVRVSVLDPFKPYVHDGLAHGVRNATVLHREITEQATPAASLRSWRTQDQLAGHAVHSG